MFRSWFRSTTAYVGLIIGSALLLAVCGGCTAPCTCAPGFRTCDALPLHGTLAPGCWKRQPHLPCYGYQHTQWCPWPAECGPCVVSEGTPFLAEPQAGARPESPSGAAPRGEGAKSVPAAKTEL